MNAYVPLWCKTNGSFLEGASHPEELVERACSFGLPAIAIADRDGVYGIVRAHVKAKECGIALIVGIFQQLAAIGLIAVMLGAIQRKIFVWKTGFWGKDGLGWNYELIFVSMLLVILCTDGGKFVVLR